MLIALFLPAFSRNVRPAARRTQCRHNLKQLAIALHNYHDAYDGFPPAYTTDAEGKPLHSWRTLILPFLDQKSLYDQIDLTKPWNDPANAEAYQTALGVFNCPSTDLPPNHTVYLAVVTPNSPILPTKSRQISEITNGTSQTLLLIEVAAEHAVHWMAPQDVDEAIVMSFRQATELHHKGGVHAVFVNGRVQFISSHIDGDRFRAMISATENDNKTDKVNATETNPTQKSTP